MPVVPEGHAPAEHAHASWTLEQLAQGAVLLPGLERVQRRVTTRSSEAQAFFDQGLALTYGFNHDEAARSFARAAELDPQCAMCLWGVAYALGPNYNMPLLPERAEAAWDAITRAQGITAAGGASPVEQALVGALAKRFGGPEYLEPAAMQAYNEAYAAAMREVAAQYPDDLDVQALYAEAGMNVNPWKLWTLEGEPRPGTEEIVAALESVLDRAPDHVGANHYYIHAVEASKHPERAEAAADRLGRLLPGAGHVVHMPAHIYQRVGRYADASAANRRAIEADLRYLEAVTPLGYYPFYIGHNYGFLAYSASMQGRSAESIAASRQAAARVPTDIVCGMPGMDFFLAEPLLVLVRFGRWSELLAEPQPNPKYPVLSALWHHAHGMALASTGEYVRASAELGAIERIAAEVPAEVITGVNSGPVVLELSARILEARIVEVQDRAASIPLWERAVALEDRLEYNEPADWFYPVRHYLGAVLLEEGRAREAEIVYRADLERNRANGWALFGLWQALRAQKKTKEASAVEQRFREAWGDADFELTRSAF
ncbi:hypothetical protein OEB96_42215 [Paraliomyxa miuraensis]|nr:hypothetical protein [Paraliomyxa miuraensis]